MRASSSPVIALAFTVLAAATLTPRPSSAGDRPAETGDAFLARVNAFIDEWHDDAAHARLAYFDKIADDGVYIGTDKSERWTRDAFRVWARRFFDRPSAWSFTPLRRNVAFTPDRSVIWFDEQLASDMGILQASGVMRAAAGGFEIVHYQLSIAVPNDVQPQVSATIKASEGK